MTPDPVLSKSHQPSAPHHGNTSEAVPHHIEPRSLHLIVLILWITVGVFTGAGVASVIGTIETFDGQGLSITEHIAEIGARAGAFFVAAVVALAAIAVVEAVLITLGHVEHIEHDIEEPKG